MTSDEGTLRTNLQGYKKPAYCVGDVFLRRCSLAGGSGKWRYGTNVSDPEMTYTT